MLAMQIRTPCEFIANEVVPNIRARLVKILLSRYGMKQMEISKTLGITQASVSQYATDTRGCNEEILRLFPGIEKEADKIAGEIAEGKTTMDSLCKICRRITRDAMEANQNEIENKILFKA